MERMITMEEKVNMSSSPINHVLELKLQQFLLEQVSFNIHLKVVSLHQQNRGFTQFASFVILST